LITSERIRVTKEELNRSWSYLDMIKAHEVLDAFDEAEAIARQRSEPRHV
jgi:hypothetical protein